MRGWMTFLVASAVTMACGGSTFSSGGNGGADSGSDGGGGPGDAAADRAAGDAASDGEGGSTGGCTAGGAFPTFAKACTNSQSCIIKFHQIDCCGTKAAVGLNHDQFTPFDVAEKAWEAQCPACGCPPGPTTAEDGQSGAAGSVQVECVGTDAGVGVCKTHF